MPAHAHGCQNQYVLPPLLSKCQIRVSKTFPKQMQAAGRRPPNESSSPFHPPSLRNPQPADTNAPRVKGGATGRSPGRRLQGLRVGTTWGAARASGPALPSRGREEVGVARGGVARDVRCHLGLAVEEGHGRVRRRRVGELGRVDEPLAAVLHRRRGWKQGGSKRSVASAQGRAAAAASLGVAGRREQCRRAGGRAGDSPRRGR